MRDIKTKLKIIWLLLSDQYTQSMTNHSGLTGHMYLWTNIGDVSIEIVIKKDGK